MSADVLLAILTSNERSVTIGYVDGLYQVRVYKKLARQQRQELLIREDTSVEGALINAIIVMANWGEQSR